MLAVLMLQMIAMGFCVSGKQAHAADMPPMAASYDHCGMAAMHISQMQVTAEQPVDKPLAACVHCDLPDVSLNLDQAQDLLSANAVLVMMLLLIMPQQSQTQALAHASPTHLQSSLSFFDLNQRIRV